MFSLRLAEKGNSNVLAHFSSIRVLTAIVIHDDGHCGFRGWPGSFFVVP